jgi:hypothetical protein
VESTIAELGKIAGIGGIALGVLFYVLRDVVARSFRRLSVRETSHAIRLILYGTFGIGALGILAWIFVPHPLDITTCGVGSAVVRGSSGDVQIQTQIEGGNDAQQSGCARDSTATSTLSSVRTTGTGAPVVESSSGETRIDTKVMKPEPPRDKP